MSVEHRGPGSPRPDGTRDESSVDFAALDPLRAIEESRLGFLARIICVFLGDARERVAEMQTAVETGNRERLTRAAHTLKSSAATVGAVRLSGLCRELQETPLETAAAGGLVTTIASEYERVATILSGIVSPAGGSLAPR